MPHAVKSRKPAKKGARTNKVVHLVHSFTLYYDGIDELTDPFVDAIYEAGCDDALLGMRCGEVFLDFDREAPTFLIALMSAIADVERAGVGLRLIRVEPIVD